MCWKCGNDPKNRKPGRSETCETCGKDLRACKNCFFFAPGAHWDCHETIPEQVTDKERGNFCDYFRYKSKGGTPVVNKNENGKNAFDSLFTS